MRATNDLISREWLLKKAQTFTQYDEGGWDMNVKAVSVEDIRTAPTVEAVPVVHGRWLTKSGIFFDTYECSVCGSRQGMNWMNYCPNCGAKMDGDL